MVVVVVVVLVLLVPKPSALTGLQAFLLSFGLRVPRVVYFAGVVDVAAPRLRMTSVLVVPEHIRRSGRGVRPPALPALEPLISCSLFRVHSDVPHCPSFPRLIDLAPSDQKPYAQITTNNINPSSQKQGRSIRAKRPPTKPTRKRSEPHFRSTKPTAPPSAEKNENITSPLKLHNLPSHKYLYMYKYTLKTTCSGWSPRHRPSSGSGCCWRRGTRRRC